jgi:hypothetical protein
MSVIGMEFNSHLNEAMTDPPTQHRSELLRSAFRKIRSLIHSEPLLAYLRLGTGFGSDFTVDLGARNK